MSHSTADIAFAYCIGDKCRQQREWARALPTSPVYACTACGRTREFSSEEPGSASGSAVSPAALPAGARKPIAPARAAIRERIIDLARRTPPKLETLSIQSETTRPVRGTRKPAKEKTMKTNILQEAIAAAIEDAQAPLLKRIETLEKALKELEPQDVSEQVETAIAQLLGQKAGRSSSKKKVKVSSPARAAAAAGAEDGDCGHKNSMSACANCRAKKAAAAEAAQ